MEATVCGSYHCANRGYIHKGNAEIKGEEPSTYKASEHPLGQEQREPHKTQTHAEIRFYRPDFAPRPFANGSYLSREEKQTGKLARPK